MLSINADDGQPVDESHTELVLKYQHQQITFEDLRLGLRALARPATVSDADATPVPEPQSPNDGPCCGR